MSDKEVILHRTILRGIAIIVANQLATMPESPTKDLQERWLNHAEQWIDKLEAVADGRELL